MHTQLGVKNRARTLGEIIAKFQTLPIILVFAVFVILLSILTPKFLTIGNILNILRQISMLFITAAGMTILLISGGVDISAGSIVSVSGVISSAAAVYLGFDTGVAITIGLLVGAALGAFNGFFVVKGKIAPIIVTLATMSIFRSIPFLLTEAKPVFGLSDSYKFLGQGWIWVFPFPLVLMVFVYLAADLFLRRTTFGIRLYALGGNENAARLSGINIGLYKFMPYIILGTLTGLSGMVLAARLGSGVSTAGVGFEFEVITAALIGGVSLTGGKGTILGTFVGCLIIGVLSNGLNILNVSAYYQVLLKGSMLLSAVLLDNFARERSEGA